MIPYTPPQQGLDAFNCPYCGAYSHQKFFSLVIDFGGGQSYKVDGLWCSRCERCNARAFWYKEKLIVPDTATVAPPNPDLDEDIQDDYREAASIAMKSPRGAAAILRLCLQKLCKQLGKKGKKIDDDIAELVKEGLPVRIQQALDVVRVIGNNAVHPGELDVKDDQATALKLFALINLVAYDRITQEKEIDALYGTLPEGSRNAITKRDTKNSPG